MDLAPFLAELQSIVGRAGIVTEDADLERYTREWRGKFSSGAIAAVRPSSTAEVSEVVSSAPRREFPLRRKGETRAWSAALFRLTRPEKSSFPWIA